MRNAARRPGKGNAEGETQEVESIRRRHILQKEQNLIKIIHHEEMSMFEPYSARGNISRETDTSKLCLNCRGNECRQLIKNVKEL